MLDLGRTWRRGFLAIIVGACLFAGSCERPAGPQRDRQREPPAEKAPVEEPPAGEMEEGKSARPEPAAAEKAPPPPARPVTPTPAYLTH